MSLFDGTQRLVITATQNLYGDSLTWVPSIGGASQTVKVLYNSPESKQTLGDAEKYEYSPYNYWFDYFIDQLVGLKASVDSGAVETVTVKGITLIVREVAPKFDGKTYIAFCDEYEDYKEEPEPDPDPLPEGD